MEGRLKQELPKYNLESQSVVYQTKYMQMATFKKKAQPSQVVGSDGSINTTTRHQPYRKAKKSREVEKQKQQCVLISNLNYL